MYELLMIIYERFVCVCAHCWTIV